MRKVKLLFLSFLLMIIILLSLSCVFKEMFSVNVMEMDGVIHLSIDERIIDYFPYEEIPSYDLTFDGKVNITENRQGAYECIFTKNDDFFVSNIIKDLIEKYKKLDEARVYTAVISIEDTNETWMNLRDEKRDEKVYLKVTDGAIYNEITYILLENGLILSVNYARFVDDNNVTYYKWQKTESIRMVLHYPFMITNNIAKVSNKNGSSKSFVLLALPLGVTYSFDLTTKRLEKLLEDDKFLEDTYYSYRYRTDTGKDDVINFYTTYFNGHVDGDNLLFDYLGINFKVSFNESYFIINLV